MLLIWDGLPSHRSRRMLEWVASQRSWLRIEPLPGYAPDLNPTEQVWGNVKSTELANLCANTVGEVATIADDSLDRLERNAKYPAAVGAGFKLIYEHSGRRVLRERV